jgi:prolipoprotein diacylglyceryl transferase
MSFHGGFIGVLVAVAIFCWRRKKRWIEVMDFVAPMCPLGLAAGRLGNFINGELPGRPTDLPWGMWFPQHDPTPIARHPSQLYQFALEGLVLFAILWWFSRKHRPPGQVSALFLIGYGTLRFIAEFARQPDDFLGPARAKPVDGAVALDPDDPYRHRDVDLVGPNGGRQGETESALITAAGGFAPPPACEAFPRARSGPRGCSA